MSTDGQAENAATSSAPRRSQPSIRDDDDEMRHADRAEMPTSAGRHARRSPREEEKQGTPRMAPIFSMRE